MISRLKQGVNEFISLWKTIDYKLPNKYLNSKELELFRKLKKAEQIHSIRVLKRVIILSDSENLAKAALLHDVGKILYPLMLWQKSLHVITKSFLPNLFKRLSTQTQVNFWNKPFIVSRMHPKWGAEILQEIGTQSEVLWFVENHAEIISDILDESKFNQLKILQEADSDH